MRKNRKISLDLENAIVDVVSSIKCYEPEYRSLLRYPGSEKERIHTFEQFVECRLNYEFYSLPGISDIAPNFDGYLLNVTSVNGLNEQTRRFSSITAELTSGYPGYIGDDMGEDLGRIREFLGGSRITIIHSKRKPTIIID